MTSAEGADVLLDYAMFKKSDGVVVGKRLQALINVLQVYLSYLQNVKEDSVK